MPSPPLRDLPFVLVTGNRNKLLEAERILGFRPDNADIDLPEIQSLDLHQVVQAKADEAWQRLQRPLVVEETGLELAAMNGFPGPLVKWMLQAVGPQGIARAAHALEESRVTARCLLLYVDGSSRLTGEGATEGRLILEPEGDQGFGWDPVFVADGETVSYAQLSGARKDQIGHRGRAWRDLQRQLSPKG